MEIPRDPKLERILRPGGVLLGQADPNGLPQVSGRAPLPPFAWSIHPDWSVSIYDARLVIPPAIQIQPPAGQRMYGIAVDLPDPKTRHILLATEELRASIISTLSRDVEEPDPSLIPAA